MDITLVEYDMWFSNIQLTILYKYIKYYEYATSHHLLDYPCYSNIGNWINEHFIVVL